MKDGRKFKDDDIRNRSDDRRQGERAGMCVANFTGRVEERILPQTGKTRQINEHRYCRKKDLNKS